MTDYIDGLRRDFANFVIELWADRGLHRVAPLSWVELDIADWIAHGPSRRGVLAPRGIGKTHLATCTLTAWRLFRNPDRKVIIPSKSEGEAKKTIGLVRDWIDHVWFLRDLRPRPDQLDSATKFNVGPARPNRQPSVTAIGIDGQLEGNRAHTIIPDDVETHENTKTLTARQDLAERVNEFESILYPDLPESERGEFDDPNEIVEVGTYHHEESVYLKEAKTGVVFRTWPLLYPQADEKHLQLAPKIAERMAMGKNKPGDIVFGHRFDQENIARKQAKGRTYFGMQHQLLCNLGDTNRYPLRLSDFMVMDLARDVAPTFVVYGQRDHNGSTAIEDIQSLGFGHDRFHRPATISKDYVPYAGTKAWIDPAGRGADKTGVAVVSYLAGNLFVKRVEGHDGGSSEQALVRLALLFRETGVREVYVEDNYGGGMYSQLLAPVLVRHALKPGEHPGFPDGWSCSLIEDTKITHAHGQKELRIIDTLEPPMSTHRIIIDRSVAMNPDLQHQITRITKQRGSLEHEDELDALAGAVKAWTYALRVDPEKASHRLEKARADAQEKAFRKLVGLPSKAEPRWFNHR